MNQAIAERIEQAGGKMDPVEAIMEIAEWAVKKWRASKDIETANSAVEWLARAAPYVRPRLAAVEVDHRGSISTARELSDADLLSIAAGSGAGIAEAAHGAKEPDIVH